jgi:hypothetical protein
MVELAPLVLACNVVLWWLASVVARAIDDEAEAWRSIVAFVSYGAALALGAFFLGLAVQEFILGAAKVASGCQEIP